MASASGTWHVSADIPIDPVLLALDGFKDLNDDENEQAQSSGVEEEEDGEEDERQTISDVEAVPLALNDDVDDADDAVFK